MSGANLMDNQDKAVKGLTVKDMETRVVKNFLDILILIEMKKKSNLSGYYVTAFVNKKFRDILSPGTVYATLYALERKDLIKGESDGRKTVYGLTAEGDKLITELMKDFTLLMTDFVRKFLII